jgi:hypothetical protein
MHWQFNAPLEPPLDVTLSDGTTTIRANFGEASIKEFSKEHGRNFSEHTLGGVLAIKEYYLVGLYLYV